LSRSPDRECWTTESSSLRGIQSDVMGSMGFFLCDWSVEFLRYRSQKKRAKKQKAKELERLKNQVSLSVQTEESGVEREDCDDLKTARLSLDHYQAQTNRLSQLCGGQTETDLVETVERIVNEAAERETEVERLKEDNRMMSESVAVQLRERDKAHSERVRSLEILMTEKEKQLLQNSNSMRQQLASAKQEAQQLQKQLEAAETKRRRVEEGSLEQEVESMLVVLDMKKEENDQLKACNNTLRLDLERFNNVDIQLQVEKQKTEEMNSVIQMKNDHLRQLLDEYDHLQHQLEIEVAAHMSCQQELEKIQWDKDNFLIENEKRWKELENQKKSGLILDVVRKEKAVAYSFNC